MSKIPVALEAAVACVIENTPQGDDRQTSRQRVQADRAFAQILKLIAPRIRHFIRQYGLGNHWDDAEQCCAIGVHRAIQAYEPEKAQFTTFVNWQIRGELQSLRFRLMTDQRPSARKVAATTVSLHAASTGADGEPVALESLIEDEDAVARTEAGASEFLTRKARKALVDSYVSHLRATGTEQLKRRARSTRPAAAADAELPRFRPRAQPIDPAVVAELEEKIALHRDVVERRLFGNDSLDDLGAEHGIPKERIRQISKRAAKTISELAGQNSQFAAMLESRQARPPRGAAASQLSLVPEADAPHNRLVRVIAVDTRRDNMVGIEADAHLGEAAIASTRH
jgi:RNA polymerase sigma factor (sigma-70 family)